MGHAGYCVALLPYCKAMTVYSTVSHSSTPARRAPPPCCTWCVLDITAIARELIRQWDAIVDVVKRAMVCESGSSSRERTPTVSRRLFKLCLGVVHC